MFGGGGEGGTGAFGVGGCGGVFFVCEFVAGAFLWAGGGRFGSDFLGVFVLSFGFCVRGLFWLFLSHGFCRLFGGVGLYFYGFSCFCFGFVLELLFVAFDHFAESEFA